MPSMVIPTTWPAAADRSPHIHGHWERTANNLVAILRAEAGRNPDKALTT